MELFMYCKTYGRYAPWLVCGMQVAALQFLKSIFLCILLHFSARIHLGLCLLEACCTAFFSTVCFLHSGAAVMLLPCPIACSNICLVLCRNSFPLGEVYSISFSVNMFFARCRRIPLVFRWPILVIFPGACK